MKENIRENKVFNQDNSDYEDSPTKKVMDSYKLAQEKVLKMNALQQQSQYDDTPSNAIDTAHVLLSNSETSQLMPEIDKEIKLANLDHIEKWAVWQFTSVWNDIIWLRNEQKKKIIEAEETYGKMFDEEGDIQMLDDINTAVDNIPEMFDAAGTFKKARFVNTLSRGKFGFERIQQIKTISENKLQTEDKTEKKPGFMERFSGGFKK